MLLNIGDRIEMKKKHPCGSSAWEVLRVGQDIRLRCEGCGRMILLSRRDVEKSIKPQPPRRTDT
ncbi:MAG: DUF951 domain-containing protein [Lachnospiraceae bacterium]|nr:DUF951 domain-containing protein [Lachnospiraceae bacterium]